MNLIRLSTTTIDLVPQGLEMEATVSGTKRGKATGPHGLVGKALFDASLERSVLAKPVMKFIEERTTEKQTEVYFQFDGASGWTALFRVRPVVRRIEVRPVLAPPL